MQYRSLDTEIVTRAAKGDEKDIVSFVASTSNADRYGDIINQNGWSLDKYRKNNIILLNHNASQLPIGRGEVAIVDGKLMVDVEFDMGDALAAEVARKVKAGFMGAVSVGFNAISSTPRSMLNQDSPYYAPRGEFFEKAELLEISIVTIPANGEATVAAKNFVGSNRLFKLSELKHVLDVEFDGDHVIVTYLLKREEPEEEIEEEIIEEAYAADDDDDKDKEEKSFLTNTERDLFALITTNGDDSDE